MSPAGIHENMTMDRFEIQKLLGEGGNGQVYRAWDLSLKRTVAIKFLNEGLAESEEERKRFLREGQVMSTLEHPNIAKVFRLGIYNNSVPYIVLEFIEGGSLSQVFSDDNVPSPDTLLNIFCQICDAMIAVHAKAIVHRDLKPNNIMLLAGAEPIAKILDFGLCRLTESQGDLSRTQTGALVGTVTYMSPEQCRGERAVEASDVYSIGCILYEAITGRSPFDAETPVGTLFKHLNEAPAPPSRRARFPLPPGLEAVCLKALEKTVDRRYKNCEDFKHDLELVRQGRAAELDIEDPVVPQKRILSLPWGKLSAGVAGLLLLLASAILFVPGMSSVASAILLRVQGPLSFLAATELSEWYRRIGHFGDCIAMTESAHSIASLNSSPMEKAVALAQRAGIVAQIDKSDKSALRLCVEAVKVGAILTAPKPEDPALFKRLCAYLDRALSATSLSVASTSMGPDLVMINGRMAGPCDELFLSVMRKLEPSLDKMGRCHLYNFELERIDCQSPEEKIRKMKAVRDKVYAATAGDDYAQPRITANRSMANAEMALGNYEHAIYYYDCALKDANKVPKSYKSYARPLLNGVDKQVTILNEISSDHCDRILSNLQIAKCFVRVGKVSKAKEHLLAAEADLTGLPLSHLQYFPLWTECSAVTNEIVAADVGGR